MIQFRYIGTDEFAQVGAELLAERIDEAVAERGVCHLAVSGGRGPWELFGVLGRRDLKWTQVHIWQVDERVAPDRERRSQQCRAQDLPARARTSAGVEHPLDGRDLRRP